MKKNLSENQPLQLDQDSVGSKTMPGPEAVRLFAGTLDTSTACEMQQAIDEGYEIVNASDHSRPTERDLVSGFGCIVRRSEYLGGRPALLGKRISVVQILELLSGGASREELRDAYELSDNQITEVLAFAASVVESIVKL